MSRLTDRFVELQRAVEKNNENLPERLRGWLLVSDIDDMLHVDYYAFPDRTPFDEFLSALCDPEIAARLKRLKLHSPDEGANGTREWEFTRFLRSSATFPSLAWLSIETYDPLDHNCPIVESWRVFQEDGVLAAWLDRAPDLRFLAAPSAPNADFFKREPHPLERLHIQAGYDTQDFVRNFSQSRCFPKLWRLEYQDFHQTYIEDYRQHCTPFEHFEQMFRSDAFSTMMTFVWHDPIFSPEELARLKAIRPKLYFRVVRSATETI